MAVGAVDVAVLTPVGNDERGIVADRVGADLLASLAANVDAMLDMTDPV